MNGVHDLGGMHGMGPIAPPASEPVFSAPWERTVFGLFITTFAAGCLNVDEFRHEIEKMGPAEYLQSSYYEHWLHAIEGRLTERGTLTHDEIESRMKALSVKEAA